MCVLFSVLYHNKGPLNSIIFLNCCQHTTHCRSAKVSYCLQQQTCSCWIEHRESYCPALSLISYLYLTWGSPALFPSIPLTARGGQSRHWNLQSVCNVVTIAASFGNSAGLHSRWRGGEGVGGWYLDPLFKDRLISPAECHCLGWWRQSTGVAWQWLWEREG